MKGFSAEPGERKALRHVDRAGARGREIIGAADMGADFARRIVDDENGDGDFRAEPLRALARQLFERGLPAGRKRQAMDAMLLVRAQRRLRGMRRQMRKGEAPMRHFLLLASSRSASVMTPRRRCARARGRAPPAPAPGSDPAGAPPAPAAARRAARLRRR